MLKLTLLVIYFIQAYWEESHYNSPKCLCSLNGKLRVTLCFYRLFDCLQESTKKDKLFDDLICLVDDVGVFIQCDECNKWRLLFSKRKLAIQEHQELEQLLIGISCTCGAKMEDIQLLLGLNCVETRTHVCNDRIEKLYYTAYPRDVLCIHCGSTENIVDSEEEMIYPCIVMTVQTKMKCTREEQQRSELLLLVHVLCCVVCVLDCFMYIKFYVLYL